MRMIIGSIVLAFAFSVVFGAAKAETGSIEVTVLFKERIGLPPDAELDVQLFEMSRADTARGRIASQRYAMTGVPMTVALTFDTQVIRAQSNYAVSAAIWSGDDMIFRTSSQYEAFGSDPIEITLTMVPMDVELSGPPRTISGVEWAVTEVSGEVWAHNEPAILSIDDQMRFSIFGGCNRYMGNLALSEGTIAFPESFAGTLMACPDDVERHERAFLDTLARVQSYVRYGAGLVLTDRSGGALLHFVERHD